MVVNFGIQQHCAELAAAQNADAPLGQNSAWLPKNALLASGSLWSDKLNVSGFSSVKYFLFNCFKLSFANHVVDSRA
jgi:hypothetical protein